MRCLVVLSLILGLSVFANPVGETVWKTRCRGCHGADGKALTPIGVEQKISDLSLPGWQRSFADQDIVQVIANGSPANPKMKAFSDRLSTEEIQAVVKYIRTLKNP